MGNKMDAPDLNEMDSMLDEIDADSKKKKVFGMEQSPINLVTDCGPHLTTQIMKNPAVTNPLKFTYPALVEKCTIMNNGHTVQINIPSSQKCLISIKGKVYQLVQFHFRTPSEHKIDSKQYEMEMHLVHANENGELCVLGFIFTVFGKRQRPKLALTQSRAHLALSKESMVNSKANADEETDNDTDDDGDYADEYTANRTKQGNDFLAQFWSQMRRMTMATMRMSIRLIEPSKAMTFWRNSGLKCHRRSHCLLIICLNVRQINSLRMPRRMRLTLIW